MQRSVLLVICVGILVLAGSSLQANELEQRVNFILTHPEEALENWSMLGEYNAYEGTAYLARMGGALSEYAILTDRLGKRLTAADKKDLGFIGWDIQNIGFPNWTQRSMASLYELDYLACMLLYKCVEQRKPAVDPLALREYRARMEKAKHLYESYLSSMVEAD